MVLSADLAARRPPAAGHRLSARRTRESDAACVQRAVPVFHAGGVRDSGPERTRFDRLRHRVHEPRQHDEAEQIVAALKKRNVPVEYLRYEDEGHGLAKLKNRLDGYPKMIAFLNRHLK